MPSNTNDRLSKGSQPRKIGCRGKGSQHRAVTYIGDSHDTDINNVMPECTQHQQRPSNVNIETLTRDAAKRCQLVPTLVQRILVFPFIIIFNASCYRQSRVQEEESKEEAAILIAAMRACRLDELAVLANKWNLRREKAIRSDEQGLTQAGRDSYTSALQCFHGG